PGERVAVVGDNGSGKSTLLRLLAGAERPDNGEVTVVAPGGVGHLAQTLDLPDSATVGDAVDLALSDLRALERRIREAGTALDGGGPAARDRYAALVAEFEARGGYDADRRVEVALRRLGEPAGLDRARRLGTLSGGRRSRLALAATLASAPELLLLDEPTNDLDDEAVAWLEGRLRAHRGTVVAVTHDRAFLDRVTDVVLEVDDHTRSVRRYGDGYEGYLRAKAAERARTAREYEQWRSEVARRARLADSHIGRLEAIPRKGPWAFSGAGAFRARSRAHGAMGRVRNARERLHRLPENPAPAPPDPPRFPAPLRAAAADAGVALAALRAPGRLALAAPRRPAGGRLPGTGPHGARPPRPPPSALPGPACPAAAPPAASPSRPHSRPEACERPRPAPPPPRPRPPTPAPPPAAPGAGRGPPPESGPGPRTPHRRRARARPHPGGRAR
ncbi:ATP-binding cassette domain-containing protein, partial [Streptomyces vinaceusdrappus]